MAKKTKPQPKKTKPQPVVFPKGLSPYGKYIKEDTGCRDVDTHQIEDVMRTEYRTLDHLTADKMRKLARSSWEAVKSMRKTDPDLFPTPPEDLP